MSTELSSEQSEVRMGGTTRRSYPFERDLVTARQHLALHQAEVDETKIHNVQFYTVARSNPPKNYASSTSAC